MRLKFSADMGLLPRSKRIPPLIMSENGEPFERGSESGNDFNPKPAYQRQCSSPSFVETYARYIERLVQEDSRKGESEVGSQSSQDDRIRASFPGDARVSPGHEAMHAQTRTSDRASNSSPGWSLQRLFNCPCLPLCGSSSGPPCHQN